MRNSLRLYSGVALLTALLVTIAVMASQVGGDKETSTAKTGVDAGEVEESLAPKTGVDAGEVDEASSTLENAVGRIAYVGLDTQIHSINPDGSDRRLISPDASSVPGSGVQQEEQRLFTWPTWSPDAQRIVFSGVIGGGEDGPRISLFAFDAAKGETSEIHVGEPGVAGLLAQGVVHYPLWSPDSRRLAFIAVARGGLTLFIDNLEDTFDPAPILDQGPLWMSWSPDSRHLLVHRGSNHFLIAALEDSINVQPLPITSRQYRVPAWQPTEGATTILSQNQSGGFSLYSARRAADGLEVGQRITDVEPETAFLWSSDGNYLAMAGPSHAVRFNGLPMLVYRGITLMPDDESKGPIEIEDDLIAYFWSPDGSKLAYVGLSDSAVALRWMVLDPSDGSTWPLVEFIPSHDQLVVFQFFDQYAYSHSPWSPDSRSLVFAGRIADLAVPASFGFGQQSEEPGIIVIDSEPVPYTQVIAEGILAFWSPR